MIVDIETSRYVTRETIDLGASDPNRRIAILQDRRIQTILCGAVSRNLQQHLNRVGIQVFAFLSGDVSQLLSAYMAGENQLRQFLQPGCRRRQRCRFGHYQKNQGREVFSHKAFGEEK